MKAQVTNGDDEFEDMKLSLKNEQKLNERLAIAYDVLCEDKVKNYLKSKEDNELMQKDIDEYRKEIHNQIQKIEEYKHHIDDLNQTIKQNMHEIDRLKLNKEALARVVDTKPLHNRIEELESELKSYESIHRNDKH